MRVVLDLMGGDHSPVAQIAGAKMALAADPRLELALVGQPAALDLARTELGAQSRTELMAASEVIDPDEQPALAARRKKDSSIVVGLRSVRDGEADAFVSCAGTGALLSAGLFAFGRLPGVRRPALGSPLPDLVREGRTWFLLDIGANVDASGGDLYTYAVIGSVYASLVLGIANPKVGLLNVGVEEQKGNEAVRLAHRLLAASRLNFIGNVEARNLFGGPADVVVSDGYSGNILLKGIEGLVSALGGAIRSEFQTGAQARLAGLLARPHLRRAMKRLDYSEYGGAPLFGLAGACVKCHGSSDARAVSNGIAVARDYCTSGALDAMSATLADWPVAAEGKPGEMP